MAELVAASASPSLAPSMAPSLPPRMPPPMAPSMAPSTTGAQVSTAEPTQRPGRIHLFDAGPMNPVCPPRRRVLFGWFLTLTATAVCLLGTRALPSTAAEPSGGAFAPPLPPPLTVVAVFAPPAQPWLSGNRGVDLAATTGEQVRAATAGVVVYAGELAGRGVVSIGRDDLRVSYEPVDALVHVGEQVERGQLIGHLSGEADACGPPGSCLHWGVRDGTTYLDPMKLLELHPPIRLLPIWAEGVPPVIAAQVAAGAPTTSRVSLAPARPATVGTKPSASKRTGTSTPSILVVGGAAVLGGGAVLGTATFAALRRDRAWYQRAKPGGG